MTFGVTPHHGGLGNQIMKFRFGFFLSHLLDIPFKILPEKTSEVVKLEDFFQPFVENWLKPGSYPQSKYIVLTCASLHNLKFIRALQLVKHSIEISPDFHLSSKCDLRFSAYKLAEGMLTRTHLHLFLQLYDSRHCFSSSFFKFSPLLSASVNITQLAKYEAIHMRWGDFFLKNISTQDPASYEHADDIRITHEKAATCIKRIKDTTLFVSTDNRVASIRALNYALSSSVSLDVSHSSSLRHQIQHSGKPSVSEMETLKDTFRDFALLALSSRITATSKSTFSQEAAEFGHVPIYHCGHSMGWHWRKWWAG